MAVARWRDWQQVGPDFSLVACGTLEVARWWHSTVYGGGLQFMWGFGGVRGWRGRGGPATGVSSTVCVMV